MTGEPAARRRNRDDGALGSSRVGFPSAQVSPLFLNTFLFGQFENGAPSFLFIPLFRACLIRSAVSSQPCNHSQSRPGASRPSPRFRRVPVCVFCVCGWHDPILVSVLYILSCEILPLMHIVESSSGQTFQRLVGRQLVVSRWLDEKGRVPATRPLSLRRCQESHCLGCLYRRRVFRLVSAL